MSESTAFSILVSLVQLSFTCIGADACDGTESMLDLADASCDAGDFWFS